MEEQMQWKQFQEAEQFLYEIPKFTTKNSPEHTKQFLALLGSPQDQFQTIHVAGSNGKGSVCKFLSDMLRPSGKKIGLFTSPHLMDIRERFQIDGELCSVSAFLEAYEIVKAAAEQQQQNSGSYPTFFEFVFAMGMVLFQKAAVEICILETGLGGRLDATNTVSAPALTIITSISLEHMAYLGDTIEAIAGEKAGIIKPGTMVICDGNNPAAEAVIKNRAKQLGSPVISVAKKMTHIREIKRNLIDFSLTTQYDKEADWQIPSAAEYQVMNAALAITGMEYLLAEQAYFKSQVKLTREQLQRAVSESHWPGRMEEVLPEVFFDGAHNLSGIQVFTETAIRLAKGTKRTPILLFSMVNDKDYLHAVQCLAARVKWAAVYVATIPGQRGLPADTLRQIFSEEQLSAEAIEDYKTAFDRAYSQKEAGQLLFCTGSLYFIGALKGYIQNKEDGDDQF